MVDTLLLVGTSTGGPQALDHVFKKLRVLPRTACCVVQHMPAKFTANLARRLNETSAWTISEATNGMGLLEGHAYIAPGGFQMRLECQGTTVRCVIREDALVSGHRPSVDALFFSAVRWFRGKIIAVLLTGMGKDGALGLKAVYDHGGITVAESEETCVVFGMPRAAIAENAAKFVIPLYEIPNVIEKIWIQSHADGHSNYIS